MKVTLQKYHLLGPETKARLYQDYHLTPLPQRGWSTVALYVDGGIAEENLVAAKCHPVSFLAPAVPNRDTKFDIHVVYTLGPANPMGNFLSRWAYPANRALGDVSIHGTAQAAGDVRDMVAAEEEEFLASPLVFRAVVAPVVPTSRSNAASQAIGAPVCDPPPRASAPVEGGTKRKEKLRRLEQIAKIRNLGSPT